jgi:hypothetical protein
VATRTDCFDAVVSWSKGSKDFCGHALGQFQHPLFRKVHLTITVAFSTGILFRICSAIALLILKELKHLQTGL